FNKYDHDREKDFNLHDPLAIYLKYFPLEAVWVKSGIEVISKGKKRGQTIFSKRNPNCEIAIDLVNPNKISNEIFSIIFGN
ncbi:MAG: hypothetical protein WCK31_05255, partial [bacterium]